MRNTIGVSPLVLIVSLLIGGAAGGIVGALIAAPLAAALEVVLGRLQDRETPVAQDPAAVETDEDGADADHRRPDAKTGVPAR